VTVPSPETPTVSKTASELTHVAPTERSLPSSTVHATLPPLQAPPQPVKTLLGAGASRTVNVEPVSTVLVHDEPGGDDPQSMPPPLTLPLPVYVTDSVLSVVGGPVKFAVTSYELPSAGTSHTFATGVVGQFVHTSNAQPAAGVAVNVPAVENATWQIVAPPPQLMPTGSLVTVPLPIT
jgi:hypothetical protein